MRVGQDDGKIEKIVYSLSDRNRDTLLWLLDFCSDILKYESVNKSKARGLAVILAPNLLKTPTKEELGAKVSASLACLSVCDTPGRATWRSLSLCKLRPASFSG